jgi:hypothetical protein
MIYAGIGSRETPDNVLDVMRNIGKLLALKGCILRSGGARGADKAFEDGCDLISGRKEIYLPQNTLENDDKAREITKQFHPNWEACNEYARRLHTRNVYQILGSDLNTVSDFVVCWTINGEPIGGTAQAIRIAEYYWIPIYNLGKEGDLDKFKQFFKLCLI